MERKNTVLLTVIAVATLLVAVVGATFAYFTATNTTEGNGQSANVTTQKELGGTNFKFEGTGQHTSYLSYPGGIGVLAAKATLTETTEDDEANYKASYGVSIKYTNNTATNLEWELYELETEDLSSNLDPKCSLVSKVDSAQHQTQFWYNDDGNDSSGSDCTFTGSGLTSLSSPVAKGQLLASKAEEQTISAVSSAEGEKSTGRLNGFTLQTDGTADNTTGKSKYYYLVVRFKNDGSNQNEGNQNLGINVSLVLDDNSPVTAPVAGQ